MLTMNTEQSNQTRRRISNFSNLDCSRSCRFRSVRRHFISSKFIAAGKAQAEMRLKWLSKTKPCLNSHSAQNLFRAIACFATSCLGQTLDAQQRHWASRYPLTDAHCTHSAQASETHSGTGRPGPAFGGRRRPLLCNTVLGDELRPPQTRLWYVHSQ